MNAITLVNALLDSGPDDVVPKDYLKAVPAWREERWCFSEQEIRDPYKCHGTDRMLATVYPDAADEDDDARPINVVVLRDGTVTDKDVYDDPVSPEVQQRADHEEQLFSANADDIADYWRDVVVDEKGNFVKFGKL
jgi:hypothetical protein